MKTQQKKKINKTWLYEFNKICLNDQLIIFTNIIFIIIIIIIINVVISKNFIIQLILLKSICPIL